MFQNPAYTRRTLNFWPSVIDMITSILIIFLLINFLDTLLNKKNIELMLIEKKQQEFIHVFTKEFQHELEISKVQVRPHLDHLQITFSDRVLFASGEYQLQYEGKRILERCGNVFWKTARMGIGQIQVEGHTDSTPMYRKKYPHNNWELSTARSISVVTFFQQNIAELPRDVFSANGYEANRPVPGASRDKNRRIEIKVFFQAF